MASSSPGLSAIVSFFYGLELFNEGQVRIWLYPRSNREHTIDVLHRLRAERPEGRLVVVWDGAPYHRAKTAWAVAASLGISLAPLHGYSPDLMPVEALWRLLRENVTYYHWHATGHRATSSISTTTMRRAKAISLRLRLSRSIEFGGDLTGRVLVAFQTVWLSWSL